MLATHRGWNSNGGYVGGVPPAWGEYARGLATSAGAQKRNTFARLRMPTLSARPSSLVPAYLCRPDKNLQCAFLISTNSSLYDGGISPSNTGILFL